MCAAHASFPLPRSCVAKPILTSGPLDLRNALFGDCLAQKGV
jgi:hypothetical protein